MRLRLFLHPRLTPPPSRNYCFQHQERVRTPPNSHGEEDLLKFPFHSASLIALAALARTIDARMEDDPDDDDDDETDDDKGGRGRSESELAQQVRRMIEKRGGGEQGGNAVALMLLNENAKVRGKLRDARTALKTAKEKGPKDDQVLVSKADGEALIEYKKYGKPEEVKTKVEKGVTLEAEKKQRDGDEIVTTAATLAKLNGKLLAKLARPDRENFIIEVRDEVKEGKTVKVPYARANKEGSAFKPLEEFAKTDLAEYHPALVAKGADGSSTTSNGTDAVFTPLPEQTPTGTAPGSGDRVSQFIDTRNKAATARPNPLNPQPAKT